MSDNGLKVDDPSIQDSRKSIDDKSDVAQDEDACTPLPEANARKSKKRLREVSTEPSSPKNEESVSALNETEADLPSKKNRVKAADSKNDENGKRAAERTLASPKTPPATELPDVIRSPAHDTKVRQIRKRVMNMSWKDGQRKVQDDSAIDDDLDAQDEGPETIQIDSDGGGKNDDDTSSKSVSAKSDSDKENVPDADDKNSVEMVDAPSISQDGTTAAEAEACQGKRRRDDEDVNPRETKRITPPPEQDKVANNGIDKPKPAAAAFSGFARYAGSSSPFATASNSNTTNVFGSTSKPASGNAITPAPTLAQTNDSNVTTKPTPSSLFGVSGFGKYASSTSPFAAAKPSGSSVFGSSSALPGSGFKSPTRPKSPARQTNAFESYSSRSGKFAVATTSRPPKKQKQSKDSPVPESGEGTPSDESGDEGADEQERAKSFSEILSAKDEGIATAGSSALKPVLKAQEVITGEEDEYTEFQVRAKLFMLDPTSTWKERGIGTLKLNVNEKTGRPRLGMGFSYGQDNRYVKFSVFTEAKPSFYTLRFSTAKHAEDLLAHVQAHTSDADLKKKKEKV